MKTTDIKNLKKFIARAKEIGTHNAVKEMAFKETPIVEPLENINEALSKYLEAIKEDYRKWNEGDRKKMSDQEWAESVQYKMEQEFEEGLHIVETQLYYRVHSKTSCHSFIVKQDGPKFKRGDILKSAGYNTPAKNQARGNIFGVYRVRWTGAEYLR